MNRAQIIRTGAGPRAVGGKFARPVDVPLPHLFEPPASQARDRAALFNLRTRPGYYNAEAKTALLRRDKQPPHDELFVDFSTAEVYIELLAAGRLLAAGPWTWQATAGGAPLTAAGLWSEVCWHRDGGCDYLEIELPLSGGWKIERQMLLARKERFLLLADALLGPGETLELRHELELPLAPGTSYQAGSETREAALGVGSRKYAAILPLALGEWRAEFAPGSLQLEPQRLKLEGAASGRRLYAPLWIDLDARRASRPLTWRRLTVGENLAAVPRDVAVGYRVQAGREQWLVYRSLTAFGNRSVLGHNTAYSFVCGRIKKDGNLEAIVEIE